MTVPVLLQHAQLAINSLAETSVIVSALSKNVLRDITLIVKNATASANQLSAKVHSTSIPEFANVSVKSQPAIVVLHFTTGALRAVPASANQMLLLLPVHKATTSISTDAHVFARLSSVIL